MQLLILPGQTLYQQDANYIDSAIDTVVKAANFIPGLSPETVTPGMDENTLLQRLSFALARCSGKEVALWFEYLVASLLSIQGELELISFKGMLAVLNSFGSR